MKMRTPWRTATAGLAAAALLMTATSGVASAQSEDDLSDLVDDIGGDDNGDDNGDDGDDNPLEELLDGLDMDEDGDDNGGEDGDDNGDDDTTEDAGSVDGDAGDIPDTGMGGFSGFANANGVIVFVGLPDELLDGGFDEVLDGLGVLGTSPVDGDGTRGIRIDLAQVQADLERAAAGEDISSEASAFVTNLLLASDGDPGSCEGPESQLIELPPDDPNPFLTVTLAGVDCEESDERAFANVQFTGLNVSLANLIAQGDEDGELRDGLDEILDPLNEGLAETDALTCGLIDGLGLTADNCDDGEAGDTPILQIENPLDTDVPLVDLDLVQATAEVTQDDESVTATATSSLAGLNLVGVTCADQEHSSTATSDGSTATRDASVSPLTGETCNTDQTLFRVLLGDEPLGDIGVFDSILQDDLFDGSAEELFDGLEELLDAFTTTLITEGTATLGPIEGAGTTASTSPFTVVRTLPLAGFAEDTPLEQIQVLVAGGETAVGVNALPAGVQPPGPADDDRDPVSPAGPDADAAATTTALPRTGAGAGLMLGLAALGAAAALRRREG